MLSVKYGADVPPALVEVLEHHARGAGLSLEAMEVIGASLDFVEAFIVAAEDGRVGEFVERAGLGRAATVDARAVANRLFGAEQEDAAA